MAIMEQTVAASRLDWTLVRPSRLAHGPARGHYRIADGHNPTGGWTLSRADLAAFLVEQIDSPTWVHRTPTLAY
jgi:putative NADH-flavin reductase